VAVSESILNTIKSRLQLITADNGYSRTVPAVIRPTQEGGYRPEPNLIVLTVGDITRIPELSFPGNPPATCWEMPVIIAGIVRSTAIADQQKNRFWSDIVKALTNATPWHTFGGYAINAMISDVESYQADDGSSAGVKVTVTVHYRTSETDPGTVRA
jgi:hypothetical protein